MDEGDISLTEYSPIDQSPSPSSDSNTHDADIAKAVQREKLIKEIQGLQESLKGLLGQIHQVEGEFEKKKADNEMLQTYVNNLTRQNMLITNAK